MFKFPAVIWKKTNITKEYKRRKGKLKKKMCLPDLADRVVLAKNPGGKMKINEAAYIFLGSPSKSHRAIGY